MKAALDRVTLLGCIAGRGDKNSEDVRVKCHEYNRNQLDQQITPGAAPLSVGHHSEETVGWALDRSPESG